MIERAQNKKRSCSFLRNLKGVSEKGWEKKIPVT
jgi:hypothetical protein